jgi:hypothetical protein
MFVVSESPLRISRLTIGNSPRADLPPGRTVDDQDIFFVTPLTKRNPFSVTKIDAPISARTANQSVSHPGKIKSSATPLMSKERAMFSLMMRNALRLNRIDTPAWTDHPP